MPLRSPPRSALSRRRFLRDPRAAAGDFVSAAIVDGVIAGEAAESRKSTQSLLAAFNAAAEKAGILHEAILENA